MLVLGCFAHGTAYHYAPGNMERVVQYRLAHHQIHPGGDYVALRDCGMIGQSVYLVLPDRVDGPFQVADCLAQGDTPPEEFVVDLSWTLAQKYHTEWMPLKEVSVCQ
jgi:hypothetical protein